MNVLLISNNDGGFADRLEIADGTTVSALFASRFPGQPATNYTVLVNRVEATASQQLNPNDHVTIIAKKYQGANPGMIITVTDDSGTHQDDVVPYTTVGSLFHQTYGDDTNPAGYQILVNGAPVNAEFVLQAGMNVTLLPLSRATPVYAPPANLQILLISSTDSGFANYVNVAAGTTVGQLFASKYPTRNSRDFTISVNREQAPSTQQLRANDRVSIVANKYQGA